MEAEINYIQLKILGLEANLEQLNKLANLKNVSANQKLIQHELSILQNILSVLEKHLPECEFDDTDYEQD